MKEQKLISMVEFVLETVDKDVESFINLENQIVNEYFLIENYANFLSQPLTLGMFVPCDEEGNVLEEPYNYSDWRKSNNFDRHNYDDVEILQQYQQAKEGVLFEGFEVKGKWELPFDYDFAIENKLPIEYITRGKPELTLTQNAIKTIYG